MSKKCTYSGHKLWPCMPRRNTLPPEMHRSSQTLLSQYRWICTISLYSDCSSAFPYKVNIIHVCMTRPQQLHNYIYTDLRKTWEGNVDFWCAWFSGLFCKDTNICFWYAWFSGLFCKDADTVPSVLDEWVVVTCISLSTVHNNSNQLVVDLIAVGCYGRRIHHFYCRPDSNNKSFKIQMTHRLYSSISLHLCNNIV